MLILITLEKSRVILNPIIKCPYYSFLRTYLYILSETEPTLRRGDSVCLVGLSRSLQATSRKSIVTNPCAALNIGSADCPRYRATNMEVIELDTGNWNSRCSKWINSFWMSYMHISIIMFSRFW